MCKGRAARPSLDCRASRNTSLGIRRASWLFLVKRPARCTGTGFKGGITMKRTFWMGVAMAALMAGSAGAQELKFAPGEDSRFNWQSFEDFKAGHSDLAGESLTLFGPWRGDDEILFNSVLAY